MRAAAGSLAVGLLLAAIWLVIHPPLPQLPTGDVFTALATARHLSRGEGLLNDTVYPLFTTYSWGREIPQPLLHRGPGLAVLLLPAWRLSGHDPARAEELVRPVMLSLLGVLVILGAWHLGRLGCWPGAAAWALLVLLSPLLALAVNWGWSEVPAAALLLALWLERRRRSPSAVTPSAAAGYALLAALLALVRQDLLWVPICWWFAGALVDRRCLESRHRARFWRRTALAAAIGVVALAPWWLHVARHTGSPLGNPLTDAVQLDLSQEWWQYPLLRGRTPLPLGQNLAENPGPALLKIRSGVRHYAESLGDWLPWLVWGVLIALWTAQLRRRRQRGHRLAAAAGPPALLAATLGLLVVQYAFFSPETRHLLPLLPLFAWETAKLADGALRRCLPLRLRHGSWRSAILAAGVGAAALLTPPNLGGEDGNVAQALSSAARVTELITIAGADLPAGPLFSDTAIVPWRLDRPFVWSPFDAAVEDEIRQSLPALRDAPYLRLLSPPADAADD